MSYSGFLSNFASNVYSSNEIISELAVAPVTSVQEGSVTTGTNIAYTVMGNMIIAYCNGNMVTNSSGYAEITFALGFGGQPYAFSNYFNSNDNISGVTSVTYTSTTCTIGISVTLETSGIEVNFFIVGPRPNGSKP